MFDDLEIELKNVTYATSGQTDVVDVESIDPTFVSQKSEYDTTDCVGNADNGQQITGLLLTYTQLFSL